MKQLIVTADDFGLAEPIDRGIREVCEKGRVSHVSVVANGENVKSAAKFLEDHPEISVGVHLNLTDGAPLSGHGALRSLLDSKGHFLGSHWRAAFKLLGASKTPHPSDNFKVTVQVRTPFSGNSEGSANIPSGAQLLDGVESEYRAQIQHLIDLGVKISQLNTHGHLHALPSVFVLVTKLAGEFKVPFVRVIKEKPPAAGKIFHPLRGFKTALLTKLFSISALLATAAPVQTNRCVGIFDSGRLTLQRFRDVLSGLKEEPIELICHPGTADDYLRKKYRWGYRWDEELKLLLSPEAKHEIERLQIQRLNFHGTFVSKMQ